MGVEDEYWRLTLSGSAPSRRVVSCGSAARRDIAAERGGLPPLRVFEAVRAARYLSRFERQRIASLRAQGLGVRGIARRLEPDGYDTTCADLQSLLAAIGGGPPYVLVAHSYSGFVATLFTRTHPGAVGGLVMIDAGTERIADVLSPAQLTNWDETNRATSPELREGVEVIDAFARINAPPPMPDVPAIVMSADKGYRVDLLPPELATSDDMVTFADWSAAQELLARQLDAEHLTDTNSGHNIYLYETDLVVRSIRQVVEEVRTAPSG